MWETSEMRVPALGPEDSLEDGMATHSSILAWRIPVDRGAWRATVRGIAKSQTRPEQLKTHRHVQFPRSQSCVWKPRGFFFRGKGTGSKQTSTSDEKQCLWAPESLSHLAPPWGLGLGGQRSYALKQVVKTKDIFSWKHPTPRSQNFPLDLRSLVLFQHLKIINQVRPIHFILGLGLCVTWSHNNTFHSCLEPKWAKEKKATNDR